MSGLALFHSGYGLRPAVHTAAERIRALGLRVQRARSDVRLRPVGGG